MFFEFSLLICLAAYLFYRWATVNNDFFLKRGIPYQKPAFLFGAMKGAILQTQSFFEMIISVYNEHNGQIYGVFDQRTPILVIRDPELIKKISIKDFDHFQNHRNILGEDQHDLFSNSLFVLRGSKWKNMRSIVSPVFTGSKMRLMFQLINTVAKNSTVFLSNQMRSSMDGVELDFQDFTTRFTNDIIASAVFGIQVNSFEDKNNDFYRMGKTLTNFTAWRNIKFFLFANFGPLMKFLKMDFFSKEITDYYMNLVIGAMKYRKQHNIVRPDMIHMLMEANGLMDNDLPNQHNNKWTEVEMVAQLFLFFTIGFDASSLLMCFAAHELMENPDVQDKLYNEVEEVINNLDGNPLTYDALQGMKYMDMVISETLRKWPHAFATDRVCNKDISYDLNDGQQLHFKNGDCVWLPIAALHYDEKYFENPSKFDPERFSDENKVHIQPFTFLPFGVGPRNCIGTRFVLIEAKAILFYMIKNFRIVEGQKTIIPLKISAKIFRMRSENGFWLKFLPRK